MPITTSVFLFFWMAFVGVFQIVLLADGVQGASEFLPLAMLGLMIAGVAFGRWLARDEKSILTEFLTVSLKPD